MSKNKGVRVLHDFDDFVEDREVILTLKDSYILHNEKLIDDDDMLINVELQDNYKATVDQENRKKKILTYEDKIGEEKKLLAQYDEKKVFKDGFMLDTEGEYNLEKIRQREAIKAKLAGKSSDKKEISLETTKNIASEYYSTEEMKKFKVPMKKSNNPKKSKEDIIAFLEGSLKEEDDDHGNREIKKAQREKVELQDMVTKKQKLENYENALDKAREKTKHSNFYEEELDELEAAIEKTRRQAQAKDKGKVEDVVKGLLSTTVKEPIVASNGKNLIEVLIEQPKVKEYEKLEELTTVNTSTDFLTTLSANAEDQPQEKEVKIPSAKPLSVKDSRQGTASILNVSLPSEKILAWTKSNTGIASVLNKKKEEEKTEGAPAKETFTEAELEELKKEVAFVEEEEISGMAAALKKLREKGYMEQHASFEISGRTNEKTVEEEFKKFGSELGKNIKLEYRDDKGRLMTPKEAFRFQCWAFHGKRPGAVKRRKRLEKELQEKKQKSVAPDQTVTMRALQKVQQETNQPFAILNLKTPK